MNHEVIFNRHVDYAVSCLNNHDFNKPFHYTVKAFFKGNKKFGSRDRRTIKELCYSWLRLGYTFNLVERREEVILSYLFFATDIQDWHLKLGLEVSLPENWADFSEDMRLKWLVDALNWKSELLFPFPERISPMLNLKAFLEHQLSQPKLWLRTLHKVDVDKLRNEVRGDVVELDRAIGLDIGAQIDQLKSLKGKVEVQDLSSQLALRPLEKIQFNTVWDCCCASGGKSLHVLDSNPKCTVYASDVRHSILKNYVLRTKRNKHRVSSQVLDLSKSHTKLNFSGASGQHQVGHSFFDLVLADVPCTGSGTWNRNPEFKRGDVRKVEEFAVLQKTIVQNALPFLRPEGFLFYSTCSVYAEENERLVDQLLIENDLSLIEQKYVLGYENTSDSMFYALLRKK